MLPVEGLPEIAPGDRLGRLIVDAVAATGDRLSGEDLLVVSQKAVSKAEGRIRSLATVEPSARALHLADEVGKDPRLVELILSESHSLIRAEPGVLIVEVRSGWICANAGIDASNAAGPDHVTLLPVDPDASARRLRREVNEACAASPAVVVADSFGRPWRLGQTDVAIGCAGLATLDEWGGRGDRAGRPLSATAIAVPDEAAAAADLARDKSSGHPACVVRGLGRHVRAGDGPGARAIQRPAADDLFR